MTGITVAGGNLVLEVEGLDKLWAFQSRLTIPLAHIVRVYSDPEIARGWWHGVRAPGTSIPGVITAGTFYQHGDRIFWDVHHPDNTIVIELRDERYAKLIVEVADPAETVGRVEAALGHG